MSYLKSVGTSFIYIVFVLSIITFWPGLKPTGDIFTEYSIKPPASLDGVLANNERLNGAEKLFEGQIKGPESFDTYNGELYTGMHGGYIGKIVGNKIVPIVKFGRDCGGIFEEHICGRPLGLKFDKKGQLYVVDAYYGIFKADVNTGKYERLFDISVPIDGEVPNLPNSIDIADNGDVYWTDSTSQFKLYDGLMAMFTDGLGRLIRYNAATKKNEVLLKGLGFANGVKLSDDESYVLVAETVKSTIVKYHLKGSKAGKSEILIAGLPGNPDNIHSDGLGNYLVSIVVPSDPEHPQLPQTLIPHPNLRKLVARVLSLVELPFLAVDNLYPNDFAKKIAHYIGSFESFSFTFSKKVTIIRFDGNGKILDALHNTDENIAGISSAFIHDNYLWLGSPFNEYLARVSLKQAFPNTKFPSKHSEKIVREEKVKPVTTQKIEATKPTTPKPTTPKPIPTEAPKPVKIEKVEEAKPILKEQKEFDKKQQASTRSFNKKVPKKVEKETELPKPVKKAEPVKQATTPKPPKGEPKVPKQPEAVEAPKQPEAVKAPKQPEAVKAPKQPEAVKAPKQPEAVKVPKQPEAVKAPKQPEAVKAPKQPEAVKAPKQPEAVKAPKQPEAVKAPKQPEAKPKKVESVKQNTKLDDEM